MKSKTSCYEPALARMELRRFAPAFAIYTVLLVLLTMNMLGGGLSVSQAVSHTRDCTSVMSLVNLVYAGVLAQLFFGDLYTTRLRYGMRSLPMTSGGWYGTQVILALSASLIPNLLNAGLMLLYVREYQIVVLWWLLASQLQFLCFYGLAVLCAVCAGNRIGMVILYTIVNFANLFVNWLISHLYVPLIFGLRLPGLGAPLSPISAMADNEFFHVTFSYTTEPVLERTADGVSAVYGTGTYETVERIFLSGHVWVTVIWAAVGIFAMWLGLRLLRKAKAESVGDLLAFPKLEPVILLLVTLGVGVVFHMTSELFEWEMTYVLLTAGMVIGYFACLMLLKRQTGVFTAKALPPLLVILAAVFLSLTLTGLDVLNIGGRIPDADKVASVAMHSNRSYDSSPLTEQGDIETVIGIHTQLLQDGQEEIHRQSLLRRLFGNKTEIFSSDDSVGRITLKYTMQDGSTLERHYPLKRSSDATPAVRKLLSRPEMVFQGRTVFDSSPMDKDGSFTTFVSHIKMVQLSCYCDYVDEFSSKSDVNIPQPEEWEGLLNAIKADCDAGSMAQEWFLHPNRVYDNINIYYTFTSPTGEEVTTVLCLEIYPECENTYEWLCDHGYHAESVR